MWYVIFYDPSGVEVARIPLPQEGYILAADHPEAHVPLPGAGAGAYLYITEGYPVVQDGGEGVALVDGAPLEQPVYVGPDNVISVGQYTAYVYFVEEGAAHDPGAGAQSDEMAAGAAMGAAAAAGGHGAEPSPFDEDTPPQQAGGELDVQEWPQPSQQMEPQGGVQVDMYGYEMGTVPLKLVPRLGYLDGKEFFLNYEGYFDLGRSPEVEIHVDDPSVSRIHARMRVLEGGALEILDLRSTNGTFINGKQIKNDIASVGDIIRFGEVPFKLVPAVGEEKRRRVNPKLLAVGALGVLVFFTMAFVGMKAIKERRARLAKSVTLHKEVEQDADAALREKVAHLKTQAQELVRLEKWDRAIQKYREALQYAPDDKDLIKELKEAQFEARNYKLYKEALDKMALQTHEGRKEALRIFRSIDPKSKYYQVDQSPVMVRLKKRLAADYRDKGLSFYNARRYKEAYENFCEYFELDSKVDPVPVENDYRKKMKKMEKRLASKKDFVPCTAQRYLKARLPVSELWAQKAAEAIRAKYPLEDVSKAIVAYMDGRIKEAIRQLNSLLKSKKFAKKHPEMLTQIQDLFLQLNKISQAYEAGESAYQQDQIDVAEKKWKVVLDLDARIMPKGVKSMYRRNIAMRLAEAYYRFGKEAMRAFRYEDAYKWFQKGLALDPDDTTDLTEGLKELEQKASDFLAEAQEKADAGDVAGARQLVDKILKITVPESLIHKQAKELKKKLSE